METEEKKEELKIEGLELPEEKQDGEETEDQYAKLSEMVDFALTKEIEKKMQGEYMQEFVYNIPFWTSPERGGKTDHGIICDKINCSMRRQGKPHTHVLGININGAEQLMRTYKDFRLKAREPKLMDIEGKQYWMLKLTIENAKDKITKPLWMVEAVMQTDKTGKFTFNENALAIMQSKGYRNLILSVVPSNAKIKWIQEYSEGKAYTPASELRNRTTEDQEKPATEPTKPEHRDDPSLAGKATTQQLELINKLAAKKNITPEQLLVYCKDLADVDVWAEMTSQQAGKIISEIQK